MSDDPNLYLEKLVCCGCGCPLRPVEDKYGTHVYPEWSDGGRMVTEYYCMPCWPLKVQGWLSPK